MIMGYLGDGKFGPTSPAEYNTNSPSFGAQAPSMPPPSNQKQQGSGPIDPGAGPSLASRSLVSVSKVRQVSVDSSPKVAAAIIGDRYIFQPGGPTSPGAGGPPLPQLPQTPAPAPGLPPPVPAGTYVPPGVYAAPGYPIDPYTLAPMPGAVAAGAAALPFAFAPAVAATAPPASSSSTLLIVGGIAVVGALAYVLTRKRR